MENKIYVIEKRFDKFDLIYFESTYFNRVYKNSDFIFSKSKNEFENKIKNITKARFDYINFWKESAKKEVIYLYDSIIENHLEIEKEVKNMDEDFCFIIRKKDCKLNYLNEIDLSVELNRASKNNLNFINKKTQELNYKIEKKLDILEHVLRIRQLDLKLKNSLT